MKKAEQIIESFLGKNSAMYGNANLRTDGVKLWSYDLCIAEWLPGCGKPWIIEKEDCIKPGGGVSRTTLKHRALLGRG